MIQNRNENSPVDFINILHLSDLHFDDANFIINCDTATNTEIKTEIQDLKKVNGYSELKQKINAINKVKKIKYIILSGDMVDCNNGYNSFKTWLYNLLEEIDFTDINNIIFCPGNHEINYNFPYAITDDNNKLSSYSIINNFLDPNNLSILNAQYKDYIEFLNTLKFNEIKYKHNKLYDRILLNDFTCTYLNSTWFCNEKYNIKPHYIGNQIFNEINTISYDNNKLHITIFHSPISIISEDEKKKYSMNDDIDKGECLINKIYSSSNIVLTGHSHGKSGKRNEIKKNEINGCLLFECGEGVEENGNINFNFYEIQYLNTQTNFKSTLYSKSNIQDKWIEEQTIDKFDLETQLIELSNEDKQIFYNFKKNISIPAYYISCIVKMTNRNSFDKNEMYIIFSDPLMIQNLIDNEMYYDSKKYYLNFNKQILDALFFMYLTKCNARIVPKITMNQISIHSQYITLIKRLFSLKPQKVKKLKNEYFNYLIMNNILSNNQSYDVLFIFSECITNQTNINRIIRLINKKGVLLYNTLFIISFSKINISNQKLLQDRLLQVLSLNTYKNDFDITSLLIRSFAKITSLQYLSGNTKMIIDSFKDSDNDQIRYGLYKYLCKTSQVDEYIDIFVDGVKYLNQTTEKENTIYSRSLDEKYSLYKGFSLATRTESLEKVIKSLTAFPELINDYFMKKNYLQEIMNKIKLSPNYDSFFDIINQLVIYVSIKIGLGYESTNSILTLLDKYPKNKLFSYYLEILHNVNYNYLNYQIHMTIYVKYFTPRENDNDIINLYNKKNNNGWLIEEICNDINKVHKYNGLIKYFTKNNPELIFNRQQEREKFRNNRKLENYKFVLSETDGAIDSIKQIFGEKISLSKDDRKNLLYYDDITVFPTVALHMLQKREKHIYQDKENYSIEETEKIMRKFWKTRLQIEELDEMISNDKDFVDYINNDKSGDLINKLKSIIIPLFDEVDFKSAVKENDKNGITANYLALFLWKIIRKFNIYLPEFKEKYIDMLSFDFLESNFVGVEYLDKLLSENGIDVKQEIINRLTSAEYENNIYLAKINYLDYAINHNIIDEAVIYAKKIISNSIANESLREKALSVLLHFEKESIIDEIVKITDNFKWKAIDEIIRLVESDQKDFSEIIKKLEKYLYSITNENELFQKNENLCRLGDTKGIDFFIDYFKEGNPFPEKWGYYYFPLKKTLTDINQIKTVIKLLMISLGKTYNDFPDDENYYENDFYNNLISILNEITQISSGSADLIINELNAYKVNNPENIPEKFNDIYKYKFLSEQTESTMTVEEAVKLLQSYEIN